MDERTFGVAELASTLGRLLNQAFPGTLWVQGQIRNLSRSKAGHVYFDLAEPGPLGTPPDALIPITLLAAERGAVNDVMRAAGAGRMEDGVEVRIAGRVGWYTPRGRLQLRMTNIDPTHTLGRLLEDRDRLLAALRADGLLTANHSRPLAAVPLRIGVVTSLGSAAHADFMHELELSALPFQIIEVDARTQGLDAGWSVAAGIAALITAEVQVIAVVRGGGSRTDLAPFDGELIARAIAGCPVPVFTGIGHEIDRSIADEVAHTAAKTPTACAALLVARVASALVHTEDLWLAIQGYAAIALDRAEQRLTQSALRVSRSTRGGLATGQLRNDEAARRLERASMRALALADQRLQLAAARNRALDPAATLARGWSITRNASGALVRSADEVKVGDRLVVTLARGSAETSVLQTTPEDDHS